MVGNPSTNANLFPKGSLTTSSLKYEVELRNLPTLGVKKVRCFWKLFLKKVQVHLPRILELNINFIVTNYNNISNLVITNLKYDN